MGKAIRILFLALLALWVTTALAYHFWQQRTERLARSVVLRTPIRVLKAATPTKGPSLDPHELAAAACGRTVITHTDSSNAQQLTCPVCPRGSDDGPADGEDSQPDPGGGWTYDSALPGHFTAPDADEVLVHTSGCESHASSLGGDFLLRRTAGRWSAVRYVHAGTAKDGCRTLPWPGGGDAVICENGDMHQGILSDALTLSRYPADPPADDAAAAPTGDHSIFLMVTDESGTCDPDDAAGDDPVQVASIKRWLLLPAGPDGRRDLELQADVEQRHRQRGGDGCRPGPVHHVTMHFRNMGDHFEATEGLAAMKALQGTNDAVPTGTVRPEPF